MSDPHAEFVERWASGRFGSGLMARRSTAKNCLQEQTHLLLLRHAEKFIAAVCRPAPAADAEAST